MPPTSGAANGRLGGRLSGGSRARKSLANVQRVRFVHPTSAPTLGSTIAGKVEALKKSEKRRKSAGDAPSADVLREIAASAARAAESAVAAAAAAQAAADAEEPPPPPKAMKRSTKSNVPPAPLFSAKRGAVVEVIAAATYGAGKSYDWDDVVDLGQKIESGALKIADVNNKDENGDWIHKVPYTTMRDWIKDDHVVMSTKKPPSVGVRGEPHWKVELEVRRRTSLKMAGGCGAGKQTVLGKVSGALQGAALDSPPSNTPPLFPPPNARTRVVDPLVVHTRREVVVGLIRWRAHECSPVERSAR